MSETITCTINKVGRSWMEAITPEGIRVRVQVNDISRNYGLGETCTFSARKTLKTINGVQWCYVYPLEAVDFIVVSRGEPAGLHGSPIDRYQVGQFLRHPDDRSRILVVVKQSSRFIPEHGTAYGVWDNEGWVHTAYCRPATSLEAATFLREAQKAEKANEQKLARIEAWYKLKELIRTDGEQPRGSQNQAIEIKIKATLLDTFNSQGSGERICIDQDGYIWYIKNNNYRNSDPDHNNIQFPETAAIGYRFPLKDVIHRLNHADLRLVGLETWK